jgi:pimeloyl-ACP methyl ester carboxylesterase
LPGAETALACFKVPVALEPQQAGGAKLALHVTVARAFRESSSTDPLFVLAGGPGQAGSDIIPFLSSVFRRVRATRDIVFIDQRGTGLSGKLDCPEADADEAPTEAQLRVDLQRCIAKLNRNLSPYNTQNSADDIEQVRRALGYGKVNLWGGSYGTRLAQAYVRRYPANVRALILDGVAAPGQIIPAGGHDAQTALEAVFKRCRDDKACATAYPQLRTEFDALMARLDSGAVPLDFPHPRTAKPTHLTLASNKVVETLHGVLYSASDSGRLPFLIHSAYQNSWGPLLARSYAGSDMGAGDALSLPLYLAVVCAEDVPRMDAKVFEEDSRHSFMKGYAGRIAALCPYVNVKPAAEVTQPTSPAVIAAPALLLSGALDPVTPPRRAEGAAKYMSAAQHFVVANAGHGVSQLGCTPRLLREFLDHPRQLLAASCLKEIAPSPFQLGSTGPQP